MGTFTPTYWFRRAVWDKKEYWVASVAAYWFGVCWDRAGYQKASMMKGQSRLFADRRAMIPDGKDVWKY